MTHRQPQRGDYVLMTFNGPDAARVEHRVGTHQWNDGRTICGRDFVVFETGFSDTVSPDTFGYVTCATCAKRLPKDIVALDYCRKRAAAGDIDLAYEKEGSES